MGSTLAPGLGSRGLDLGLEFLWNSVTKFHLTCKVCNLHITAHPEGTFML